MSQNLDPTSYDPYRIDSLPEVDKILRQLLDQGVLLRMHSGNPQHAVITTLIDLDFTNDTIIIDSAAQQTINAQLVASETAFFDALLDSVSIKFQVSALYSTVFEDRPALAGPLPAFLYRIQRRENFRVRPTFESAAQCTIYLDDQSHLFDVYDISASGVALIDPDERLTQLVHSTLEGCELHLPQIGRAKVNLHLIRSQNQILYAGKKLPLVGCAFSNTEATQLIRIRNFILSEERKQIARDRGLA
ncbi:flagellar brake protein [Paenalcaligenes hominis]|uniref:flagellar brake protein n=1 Tax=Paenalcaligenes hominis TaxID=643674 RepID=UPI0035266D6A